MNYYSIIDETVGYDNAIAFVFMALIVALVFLVGGRIRNRVFNKSVSLIDLHNSHFILKINNKEFLLKKQDIKRLRISEPFRGSGWGMTLKTDSRTFHFSASDTDEMEHAVKQFEWKIKPYAKVTRF